jgi:hypothetical protein
VVEISVLDLISQTTRGGPINRMALHWNAAASKYEIIRRLPLVAPISPQFVRRREDKRVAQHDIRVQQVSELVEVPLVDRDARSLNLTPSQVLRREVCTKVLKGQTMVRKLVMWQTNKESEDFPAFVIHLTDFSPGRKTPLEREIRVSNSRQQIDDLWQELAAETFTKGWTPAGGATPTASPPPAPAAKPATKKSAAPKKKP